MWIPSLADIGVLMVLCFHYDSSFPSNVLNIGFFGVEYI